MNDSVWEILVPTMMNDNPVRTKHHKEWDKKVKKITGGLTITPPTKGYWISPDGETIRERMIPVRVMCTEEEINKISDITAQHYNQDAIMFYRISDDVRIISYDKQNIRARSSVGQSS